MNDGTYVAFLVIGIVAIAIDGQLVYRSGLRYLANSYTDKDSAVSMARLIAVFFHLIVLGVLFLLSVIDFNVGSDLENVVLKSGVVLLMLAAAHGITMAILNRMHDRLDAEELTMERAEQRMDRRPLKGRLGGRKARTAAARVATTPSATAAAPVRPVTPAQPMPAQPAAPTQQAAPVQQAAPAQPVTPVDPSDPAIPAQSTTSARPAAPGQPTTAQPTTAAQPADAARPTTAAPSQAQQTEASATQPAPPATAEPAPPLHESRNYR